MTLGERIRDHLAEHGAVSAPEAAELFSAPLASVRAALRMGLDCGVLAPLAGLPRRYRLAYSQCPVFGLVGVT